MNKIKKLISIFLIVLMLVNANFSALASSYATESDAGVVEVTVSVIGNGQAKVNGNLISGREIITVPVGTEIIIEAIEIEPSSPFIQMYECEDGYNMVGIVSFEKTFSKIVHTTKQYVIHFAQPQQLVGENKEIIFFQDKTLKYRCIDKYYGTVQDLDKNLNVSLPPKFGDTQCLGWSFETDNNGTIYSTNEELINALKAYFEQSDSYYVNVYAVYEDFSTVTVPEQDVPIRFDSVTQDEAEPKLYFVFVTAKQDDINILQAGIIATKNEEYATAGITTDLIGKSGVMSGEIKKGDDGYVGDVYYTCGIKSSSGGTIYARGYAIVQNKTTGEISTFYTEQVSGTIIL